MKEEKCIAHDDDSIELPVRYVGRFEEHIMAEAGSRKAAADFFEAAVRHNSELVKDNETVWRDLEQNFPGEFTDLKAGYYYNRETNRAHKRGTGPRSHR